MLHNVKFHVPASLLLILLGRPYTYCHQQSKPFHQQDRGRHLFFSSSTHFLESLELGIRNLVHFMKDWSFASQFPELNNLVAKLNTPETQQKINHLIHN